MSLFNPPVVNNAGNSRFIICELYLNVVWKGGYAVAQLVEALRYKPEGRGFDSR